jgi:hypothetical protein
MFIVSVTLAVTNSREPMYRAIKPAEVEVAPFYDKFKRDRLKYTETETDEHVYFYFSDLKEQEFAFCDDFNNERVVHINETEWNKLIDAGKEMLLYHELGHCILGLEHYDKMKDEHPVSLMHAYDMDFVWYIQNREYYVKELFSHTN